jgi:hypothetical protein
MGVVSGEGEPPPKPIYCHHDDVVAYIHGLEIRLAKLGTELAAVRRELAKLTAWAEEDEANSSWFYAAKEDIRDLVDSKRWIGTSRRFVLMISGTIAGIVMAWNAVEIFIKEHSK